MPENGCREGGGEGMGGGVGRVVEKGGWWRREGEGRGVEKGG